LDYRVTNNTSRTYQLLLHTDGDFLYGELRTDKEEAFRYSIRVENDRFVRTTEGIRRRGDIFRDITDQSGRTIKKEHLLSTNALVMYNVAEELLSPE
jgi:hypothetical protein